MISFICINRLVFSFLFVLAFGTSAFAEKQYRVPLKLFGKDVIENYDGCSFALWQHNKKPGKDKYPYIFFAPIHDGGELPAWVQIGKKVYELERKDTSEGGPDYIPHYQLFRSQDEKVWGILNIVKQRRVGNDILIDKAELTVVQSGKFPFVASLKGKNGCPASAYAEVEQSAPVEKVYRSLDGDPAALSKGKEYQKLSSIPRAIRQYISKNYAECDLEQVPPYSVRYALSPQMSLWQVPCALYARNATVNYFIALNNNPKHVTPLFGNHPSGLKGFKDGDLYALMNAYVKHDTASIIASESGARNDCGTYWKYKLRVVPGETIEAFLVEYRKKEKCDGVEIAPRDMPIVFEMD